MTYLRAYLNKVLFLLLIIVISFLGLGTTAFAKRLDLSKLSLSFIKKQGKMKDIDILYYTNLDTRSRTLAGHRTPPFWEKR
nr:hypothetical protein [Desulfobacterales bacterium]